MRRDKWIERLKKVSQGQVAAVALFLLLLPLYAFPYWVKYGWGIPVRGKFFFTDMSTCAVEPYILGGDKLLKGFRSQYVTVIPDRFPYERLFGTYELPCFLSSAEGCAVIHLCECYPYYDLPEATIVFHPNPYIQTLLEGCTAPSLESGKIQPSWCWAIR